MAEKRKKIPVRVPDDIRYQPVEWLVEYPGYKMRNSDKIMKMLKKLGCITIEDYIAHKTEFTEEKGISGRGEEYSNGSAKITELMEC